MATASGIPEVSVQIIKAAPDTDDEALLLAGTSRKRSWLHSLDEALGDCDDPRPKTRRVNPQRLAIRLGSDLVGEMEALIVPGAKMPTFAVRKDFQERYQVDRRHIYDYFHSRGLRVAKEDRHTNLTRGRLRTQEETLTAAGMGPPHPTLPKEENSLYKVKKEENSSLFNFKIKKEESPDCETSLSFLSKPVLPKLRGLAGKRTSTLGKRSYTRRAGAASSRPIKRSRKPTVLVQETVTWEAYSETAVGTSSGTDTDWESSSPCPQFSFSSDSSDDTGPDLDFLLYSPHQEFVAGFDSPDLLDEMMLDPDDTIVCDLDDWLPEEDNRILTEFERTEIYELVRGSICHSHRLDAYHRHDLLTDGLLSRLLSTESNQKFTSAPFDPFETTLSDNHDLQKWLTDDRSLYQPIHETSTQDSSVGQCTVTRISGGLIQAMPAARSGPLLPCQVHNQILTSKHASHEHNLEDVHNRHDNDENRWPEGYDPRRILNSH